jgi:hypothetical protein
MDTLAWLTTEYPSVAIELEQARSLPPIPPDTPGDDISILFEDVQLPPDAQLPADYQPELMTMYASNVLVFVKAQGKVLLNRLPDSFPIST